MSRTGPRTELPGFQTIAEMQTTQRTSIGLCEDTPVYINPAAETLQRTMPWGEEVTDRWSQELPVLTTAIEIAAPGAYRLEKDDTGRVVYSPVKARKAPIAEAKATKRAAPIQQHIEGLNEEMTSLEASTRIRNEELHRHLDAIRQRGANWEAKLKLEVQARDEASKMLRQHFDTILEEATTEEESNLMKMIERFHGELIPAQETRQAKLEDDVTEWVDVTIPETIDRLTGAIARKLQKVLDLCRNHAIDATSTHCSTFHAGPRHLRHREREDFETRAEDHGPVCAPHSTVGAIVRGRAGHARGEVPDTGRGL